MRMIEYLPPTMRRDFGNHLLMQIEMLRAAISHEQLSKRLGSEVERRLARYIAGLTWLNEAKHVKNLTQA
jgi:hypothetical protein